MAKSGNNKGELRVARYDAELMVEAYQFQGVMQSFPNHFHEHYVIGFIERGSRCLRCNGQTYRTAPGDLLLFNPGDNHACESMDGQPLDYRCVNIGPDVMSAAAREIAGLSAPPVFVQPVVFHCDLIADLRELNGMILRGESGVRKEERFYFLLEQLLRDYAKAGLAAPEDTRRDEIRAVCSYLETHLEEPVSLDALGRVANLSKYHLLRAFTKETGITPYSYLETLRIDRAKALLKGGASPVSVAQQAGFSDQSHFSKAFKQFIGLTPGQYRRVFAADSKGSDTAFAEKGAPQSE